MCLRPPLLLTRCPATHTPPADSPLTLEVGIDGIRLGEHRLLLVRVAPDRNVVSALVLGCSQHPGATSLACRLAHPHACSPVQGGLLPAKRPNGPHLQVGAAQVGVRNQRTCRRSGAATRHVDQLCSGVSRCTRCIWCGGCCCRSNQAFACRSELHRSIPATRQLRGAPDSVLPRRLAPERSQNRRSSTCQVGGRVGRCGHGGQHAATGRLGRLMPGAGA